MLLVSAHTSISPADALSSELLAGSQVLGSQTSINVCVAFGVFAEVVRAGTVGVVEVVVDGGDGCGELSGDGEYDGSDVEYRSGVEIDSSDSEKLGKEAFSVLSAEVVDGNGEIGNRNDDDDDDDDAAARAGWEAASAECSGVGLGDSFSISSNGPIGSGVAMSIWSMCVAATSNIVMHIPISPKFLCCWSRNRCSWPIKKLMFCNFA